MNQNYGGYVGQQPGMRPPYMQVRVGVFIILYINIWYSKVTFGDNQIITYRMLYK